MTRKPATAKTVTPHTRKQAVGDNAGKKMPTFPINTGSNTTYSGARRKAT